MRSCVKLFAIILLVLLPVALSAVDLQSLGYTVVSTQRERSGNVYEVRDEAGHTFSVQYTGTLSDYQGSLIKRSVEEFFGWNVMEIGYMRISTQDPGVQVLIIPKNYIYDDVDLTPYLPSGMQFYVDRIFEYDFRINVERIFIRLRGQLADENRFTERLASAVEDPAGFIERNDPDYVLRELRDIDATLVQLDIADEDLGKLIVDLETRLTANLDEFKGESLEIDDAIRADLAQTVSQLRRLRDDVSSIYDEAIIAFNELRIDYLETKKYGAEVVRDYNETKRQLQFLKERYESHVSEFASLLARVYENELAHADLLSRHEALLAEHEALSAAHEELKAEYEAFRTEYDSNYSDQESADAHLQDQISWLRYAFIGIANKSFFGQLRHVEEADAARIVELKQANPAMTIKEISSTLSSEDIKVSEKGIRYVLLTYLGIQEE